MLTFNQFLIESSNYINLKQDAGKMSLSDFFNKYSVEGIHIGNQKHMAPHHYFKLTDIDPSEHDSWDNPVLSAHMRNKVDQNRKLIRQGSQMPPMLVVGRPDNKKWRPMVLDGHHRGIAAYRENIENVPVWFNDETLKEIHKHANV